MSNSTEPLLLESQTKLLESLRLLSLSHSSLISVTGKKGAGKTWLADRYFHAWTSDKKRVLIDCKKTSSITKIRTGVLSSLFPDHNIQPHSSLTTNFHALSGQSLCDVVLIFDNADKLSERFIYEFWDLVEQSQLQPLWHVSIVLFSLPNTLDTSLAIWSKQQNAQPNYFAISQLSSDEAELFLEKKVIAELNDPEEADALRAKLPDLLPIPGEIMAFRKIYTPNTRFSRFIGPSKWVALGGLVFILAIVMGYVYFLQPKSTQFAPAPIKKVPVAVKASVPSEKDDAADLPKAVINTTTTLTASNTGQKERAVINAETLDKIEKEGMARQTNRSTTADVAGPNRSVAPDPQQANLNQTSANLPNSKAAANSSSPSATQNDGQNAQMRQEMARQQNKTTGAEKISMDSMTPIDNEPRAKTADEMQGNRPASTSSAQKTVAVTSKTTSKASQTVSQTTSKTAAKPLGSDDKKLLSLPSSGYSLQLGAFKSEADLKAFIHKYKASLPSVYHYLSVRHGVKWHIVTYNSYPTSKSAKADVANLPPAIKALQPWPKSIKQIQTEIKNRK